MINSRALVISGILFAALLILLLKLFTIQIAKHEYYTRVAETQQYKPQIVKAERGLIKDANGEVLSYTFDDVSFFVDKRMMNENKVDSIASVFSREIGKPKSYYINLIKDGNKTVCLENKVPMEQAIKLKKLVLDGLTYQEDFSRVYPYGSSASHILGYVDKEGTGVEGIEKLFNTDLTGNDGYYVFERDVLGRILSTDDKMSKAPQTGNTINLTISKNYQKILEEEIANGIQKFGGESAVGIIMNPNSGEILALANFPDFDPANYNLFDANNRRNRAITDTYEPGSTMKAVTMSILLDNNLVNEGEVINTENGSYKYKSVPILDSHKFSVLTVREILEQSSNIGMSKLIERVGDDVFYRYLRDFGFSNKTLVDLPSEAEGTMKLPKNFSGISKAFMSFGYEVAVTPLQMVSAFCALVNGGSLYQPYITKSVTDHYGNVVSENQPTKIRTVIKQSTSNEIKNMLVGVVEQGSGTAAQLPDVLVGGKTGTSQKLVNNSYTSAKHNSSFIGFFPAENPKIVIYVLINSPSVGQYGGLVAAPVFHEIAKKIIESDVSLVPNKKKIERKNNLMNQLIADMKNSSKRNSSPSRSYLNVAEKKTIVSNRKFLKRTTMPNLANQSMRDAIAQLNEMGLQYKVAGIGKVVWQSIEPGATFSASTVCSLKCEPNVKKVKQTISE
jgi:cell division protein FtsI (penicillin-binding protein 3)